MNEPDVHIGFRRKESDSMYKKEPKALIISENLRQKSADICEKLRAYFSQIYADQFADLRRFSVR